MTSISKRNSVVITSLMATIAIISIVSLSIDTTTNSHNTPATNAHNDQTIVYGLQDSYSVDEFADRALYIVKGTIREINYVVDESGERFGGKPIVFTEAVITVEEELTGKYRDTEITVRTLGGISGGFETTSFMHPRFAQNEQVVIFVGYEPESEMGDHYFVYGNNLGKYLLENGNAIGADYPEGLAEAQFLSNIRR